ncbi:uncharacterized protein [Oscarella lobularis]|uniref:uncharacterized protein isoform X2 n=1 Tax=Oscarella lobularis TaxID=121494 RepID=UPI003314259E
MAAARRDVELLKNSKLMSRSEFGTMVRALDAHFSSVDVARRPSRDHRKETSRTFYHLLLKMLYEVTLTATPRKQMDDLKRVHKWFEANRSQWETPSSASAEKETNGKSRGKSQWTLNTSRQRRVVTAELLSETLTVQKAHYHTSSGGTSEGYAHLGMMEEEEEVEIHDVDVPVNSPKHDEENSFTSQYIARLMHSRPVRDRYLSSVNEDQYMNALSQGDSVVDFDMDDIVVQAIANARNTEDPQKVETPTTKSVLTSSSSMADSCDDEGYDAGDRQPYVVRGIVGRSHAVRPALFPDSTTLADVDSKRSDVQKSTRKRNVSLRTISPKERPIISKKEAWDDGGNDLDASCGSLLTSQSIVTESATSGLFSITDSIDDVSSVRDSHAVPPPPTPSSDAPKRKSASPSSVRRRPGRYCWTADGVGGSTYMKRTAQRCANAAQRLTPRLHTQPVALTRCIPATSFVDRKAGRELKATMRVKRMTIGNGRPKKTVLRRQMSADARQCKSEIGLESDLCEGDDISYRVASSPSVFGTPSIVIEAPPMTMTNLSRSPSPFGPRLSASFSSMSSPRPSSAASALVTTPRPSSARPSSARSRLHSRSLSAGRSATLREAEKKKRSTENLKDLMDPETWKLHEAKLAVNIQQLFRDQSDKKERKQAEKTRRERAARVMQRNFRYFLSRKKEIAGRLAEHRSPIDPSWSTEHQKTMWRREEQRRKEQERKHAELYKTHRKRMASLKEVKAHTDIRRAFHKNEVPLKVQEQAAVAIQKIWKGYRERKARKDFLAESVWSGFCDRDVVKDYYRRVVRLQIVHGSNVVSNSSFVHLKEYVQRRNAYCQVFAALAEDGRLKRRFFKTFFNKCGHYPQMKEINDALTAVTKNLSADDISDVTLDEALDAVFSLYLPRGCNIVPSTRRSSTWLNPLVNGVEAMGLSHMVASKTGLDKCLRLIAETRSRSENGDPCT